MATVADQLRVLRDRAVRQAVDRVAERAAAQAAAGVVEPVLKEIAELRRILGDQGDAADEVAEVIGRSVTRLSSEVSALAAELARLRERLDRLGQQP